MRVKGHSKDSTLQAVFGINNVFFHPTSITVVETSLNVGINPKWLPTSVNKQAKMAGKFGHPGLQSQELALSQYNIFC